MFRRIDEVSKKQIQNRHKQKKHLTKGGQVFKRLLGE